MNPEELHRELAAALRRMNAERDRTDRELAELRARVEQLTEILVHAGALNAGNLRLIDKVAARAASARRPTVRLRQYVDKYSMAGNDIDCEARLPLCHARCCSFSFELSTQDLDEGVVRWEIDEPYVIRHDGDGYCTHLDRTALGCSVYERRPATCRGFDCRGDKRVWLDFDARIPAPMPEGLSSPR